MLSRLASPILAVAAGGAVGFVPTLVSIAIHLLQSQPIPSIDPWGAAGTAALGSALIYVIRANDQGNSRHTDEIRQLTNKHADDLKGIVARYDTRMGEMITAYSSVGVALNALKSTVEIQGKFENALGDFKDMIEREREHREK